MLIIVKFRRAFENVYKLLRPGGKALIMFLAWNNGFDAYVKLHENPRYKPYMQVARQANEPRSIDHRQSLNHILIFSGRGSLHTLLSAVQGLSSSPEKDAGRNRLRDSTLQQKRKELRLREHADTEKYRLASTFHTNIIIVVGKIDDFCRSHDRCQPVHLPDPRWSETRVRGCDRAWDSKPEDPVPEQDRQWSTRV